MRGLACESFTGAVGGDRHRDREKWGDRLRAGVKAEEKAREVMVKIELHELWVQEGRYVEEGGGGDDVEAIRQMQGRRRGARY